MDSEQTIYEVTFNKIINKFGKFSQIFKIFN